MTRQRTKITILSGFLGAGKTTLLNQLLRATPEPRGVIVNDYGAVNVDAQLVGSPSGAETEVALNDGCICCSIQADLLDALLTMLQRPLPPRHILIETSGVSDPAAVARTCLHRRLRNFIELSAIVVCVDPSEFARLIHQHWELATDQVRVADFVVLTKGDLVGADDRVATRELLRNIAADVRVVESSLGDAPTDLLLDTAYVWSREQPHTRSRAPVHVHEVGEASAHRHDGHAYETWTFRTQRPMSIDALRQVLMRLPPSVYRAKGFVHAAEEPDTRMVVQVTGRRVELARAGSWGAEPRTELVCLGPAGTLEPARLLALLEDCYAVEGEHPDERFMRGMVGFFERLLDDGSRSRAWETIDN